MPKTLSRKPSTSETNKGAHLVVRAVHREDWPVIERLFGNNGACGGCWCMHWRVPRGGKLWEESKGARNRQAFRKLVTSGKVYGCIAFHGDEPVGWCCVGPRADFPRLERTKALATGWTKHTWSIVCFYIPARWRHRGVATALIRHAVQVARSHGATELEGYPLRPQAVDRDIPAAFAWTGVTRLFERQRFTRITPPEHPRDVYRRRFRRLRAKP